MQCCAKIATLLGDEPGIVGDIGEQARIIEVLRQGARARQVHFGCGRVAGDGMHPCEISPAAGGATEIALRFTQFRRLGVVIDRRLDLAQQVETGTQGIESVGEALLIAHTHE
jgi:hypothetical protein